MTDGPGFAARTDVGLQRTVNEDRYLTRSPVFAVADGMGGHQAGEVAAQLAVGILEATAEATPIPDPDQVADAIERSNLEIRREARLHAEMAGMGTTCTAVVVGDGIRVAHVGDSRVYRLRDGRLEQLTDDHSLVATMVREGVIDPTAARTDGRRNIVTRALGAEDEVRVDRIDTDRAPGDRLVLCSDGLHGQVDDAAIAAVLADAPTPAQAADRLVDLANAAGGDDNVTVIVIDCDNLAAAQMTDDPASPGATADDHGHISATDAVRAHRVGPRLRRILIAVAVFVAALLVAGGLLIVGSAR